MKPLSHVLRQKKVGELPISLLVNEKGVDPVTGHEMKVVEVTHRPESYDGQLRDLLSKASNTEEGILDCVDGCLWLFAASGGRTKSPIIGNRFTELLEKRIPISGFHQGIKVKLGP